MKCLRCNGTSRDPVRKWQAAYGHCYHCEGSGVEPKDDYSDRYPAQAPARSEA